MSHYTQVPAPNCLPCCFYETCAVDGIMFSGEEQPQEIANKCKPGMVWKEDKSSK